MFIFYILEFNQQKVTFFYLRKISQELRQCSDLSLKIFSKLIDLSKKSHTSNYALSLCLISPPPRAVVVPMLQQLVATSSHSEPPWLPPTSLVTRQQAPTTAYHSQPLLQSPCCNVRWLDANPFFGGRLLQTNHLWPPKTPPTTSCFPPYSVSGNTPLFMMENEVKSSPDLLTLPDFGLFLL